jgi:hypothetical protein
MMGLYPLKKLPKLVLIFLVIDFMLVVAHFVNFVLREPNATMAWFFDLESEQNLPTWFSTLQLAMVGFMASVFCYKRVERANRQSWYLLALPIVFWLCSLDEIAQLHERVGYRLDVLLPDGDRANTPFGYTGIWMFVVGIPFLVLMFGVWLKITPYFKGNNRVGYKMLAGLLIFVGGACGFETLANFQPYDVYDIRHILQVMFEESFELLGATVLLWSMIDLMRVHGLKFAIVETPPDTMKPQEDSI